MNWSNFSVNSFSLLSLRRSFMCWMCRHLLDYIFSASPHWGCVFLSIILTVASSHRLLLCCKRPDCPLNVFFYITLHFFPFYSPLPLLVLADLRVHGEFSNHSGKCRRFVTQKKSSKPQQKKFPKIPKRIFREFAVFSPRRTRISSLNINLWYFMIFIKHSALRLCPRHRRLS